MSETDRRCEEADPLRSFFSEMWEQLLRLMELDAESLEKKTRLDDAIEQVVDSTSPRVRIVSDYQGRLRRGVHTLIDYLDEHVAELPPALLVRGSTFVADSRVNAFFVNKDHIWTIFGRNRELTHFFKGHPGADEAFALLSMLRKEKSVLATGNVNGVLVRDVPKITVSFSEHDLLHPHSTEEQTRHALKWSMLNSVLLFIRGYLAYLGAPHDPRELRGEVRTGFARYLELSDRDLKNPETYLEVLSELLGHPEQLLDINTRDMCVNRMGILVERDAAEVVNQFDFHEMALGHIPPRILVLVRYPRNETENHPPPSSYAYS